jgi:hypothetical protein
MVEDGNLVSEPKTDIRSFAERQVGFRLHGVNSLVPDFNQTDVTPGRIADFVINWLNEWPLR